MIIQSWMIAGLVAGALIGILVGRGYGFVGNVLSGAICGLVGTCFGAILFVVSGTERVTDAVLLITAFIAAVVLIAITRISARARAI